MSKDPFALQPPGAPQGPQAANYMSKVGQQSMEAADVSGDYVDNGKPHRALNELAPINGQMQPGQQIQTMGATRQSGPQGLMPTPHTPQPNMAQAVNGQGRVALRGLMPMPPVPQAPRTRADLISMIREARNQQQMARRAALAIR